MKEPRRGRIPRVLLPRFEPFGLEYTVNIGCCSRDCGCCLDAQCANSSAGALGMGHCTLECGCCIRSRGYELSEEREKFLLDRFSSDDQMDTMDHQVDPYQRRICLVYIWGLSVDDS